MRLAEAVKKRRVELGMFTMQDAIRRSGVAAMTWRRIEEGRRVQEATHRKVEGALEWKFGSCEAILAGGEPTPVGGRLMNRTAPDPFASGKDKLTAELARLKESIARVEEALEDAEEDEEPERRRQLP